MFKRVQEGSGGFGNVQERGRDILLSVLLHVFFDLLWGKHSHSPQQGPYFFVVYM